MSPTRRIIALAAFLLATLISHSVGAHGADVVMMETLIDGDHVDAMPTSARSLSCEGSTGAILARQRRDDCGPRESHRRAYRQDHRVSNEGRRLSARPRPTSRQGSRRRSSASGPPVPLSQHRKGGRGGRLSPVLRGRARQDFPDSASSSPTGKRRPTPSPGVRSRSIRRRFTSRTRGPARSLPGLFPAASMPTPSGSSPNLLVAGAVLLGSIVLTIVGLGARRQLSRRRLQAVGPPVKPIG